MQRSVQEGHVVTLDSVDCRIDGLKVQRVGDVTFGIVSELVDDIVTLPDRDIFAALLWPLRHCKVLVEGAAAAPVAALLHDLISAPPGAKVVCVLSGGNVNLDALRELTWN
jgi:threonine dehydratase